MTTVFLSYARDDDEPFVARLFEDLVRRGFEVWWDRRRMPSRGLTFLHEIREAIDASERFVLVVGPRAATSSYVVAEWRHALAGGKPVTPVLRLGGYGDLPGELRLLHCEDFRADGEYEAHLAELVRQLSEPVPVLGRLIGVPPLPRALLPRPGDVRAVRAALLADLVRPVMLTGAAAVAGVQGMGGIGKSVLANLLARDLAVRRAFPDGLVWVTVGAAPDVVGLQRDVARALGGAADFGNAYEGRAALAGLLAERAVLLVLDDVWERPAADALLALGPRCRALLTTRDAGLVGSLGAEPYAVPLPEELAALALLAAAAGTAVDALPPEGREVVREAGRLPLALALCGGLVRRGVPWAGVLDRLRHAALEHIGDRHAAHPSHRSLWAAIQASVDALPAGERERFCELGVFVHSGGIPAAAVRRLWRHTGGLGDYAAEDLLVALAERSLLRLDRAAEPSGESRVVLHGLLQDYVARAAGAEAGAHQRLLDAYRAGCPDGWASGPADGYFHPWLVHHLLRAGRAAEVLDLLFDVRWLQARLDLTPTRGVERDCRFLLQSALPLSAEARSHLAFLRETVAPLQASDRLATVLWGHLAGSADPAVQRLLDQARALARQAWLRPLAPSLSTAGGPLREIGDAGPVESLAIGDTAEGDPIVAATGGRSPVHVRLWIGESRLGDAEVPPGHAVTALNLPGDGRPALLHTWTEEDRGTRCRLLDLSAATFDVHLRAFLQAALRHPDEGGDLPFPRALGPVMVLGKGEPHLVGRLAGRLVVVASVPQQAPSFVGPGRERLVLPDLMSNVDPELVDEFMSLLRLDIQESDVAPGRREGLAEKLTAALGKPIALEPAEAVPARTLAWDVETGQPKPEWAWPLPGSARPLLVGEALDGVPFLVYRGQNDRAWLWRIAAPEPERLSWMSFADQPVLTRSRGRPVLLQGGFQGLEVVDATTCERLGSFDGHRDEPTLIAAVEAADGTPLAASAGRLGSRGRFSTSVHIWDVATQTQVWPTGTLHTSEIEALTAGRYRGEPAFATGSWGLICVWRAQALPGWSAAQEPREIPDPNLCGRLPAAQLPADHRHHDLGAVCLLPFGRIVTWAAPRSDRDALHPTSQEWGLGPPDGAGVHAGTALAAAATGRGSDVVAVALAGPEGAGGEITTIRRDGTRRRWTFSLRADWERQSSDWRFWHCTAVVGPLAGGTWVDLRIGHSGEVTLDYRHGAAAGRLTYDPGCPATQCALGEGGAGLVVFDERGAAHHLKLVLPAAGPGPAKAAGGEDLR